MFAPVRNLTLLVCYLAYALLGTSSVYAQNPVHPPMIMVEGKVGLASLVALSDGYLIKLADTLRLIAASPEGQSGDWQKIKAPLIRAGQMNVPALNWFALPDGSYWSVQEGRASGNLSSRAYFPRLLAGQTVIGDLVVSKATGKSTAIVAVPIVLPDKRVIGILGSSVYLDQLSARLEHDMALDDTTIFYSFDAQPLTGLTWEPGLIFADPTAIPGEEEFARVVREMMSRTYGTSSYRFHNRPRTVLFQRSTVTGWWYAFGNAPEGRDAK